MDTANHRAHTARNGIMDFLTLAAGIVLLISVSLEVARADRTIFSDGFLLVQLCACIIFFADYFVRLLSDGERYARRHLPYLLLSIPYLNIIAWCGIPLDRSWMMVVGFIPLMRALIAGYVVVRWFTERGVRRMFTAYALTVLLLTYIAGLIFYEYELGINPNLHGFGNAVWWAFMGMTTVGAAIFPVTAAGKILAVVLPALGMLMLPLFTVYIADFYKERSRRQ